jgi:predicted dehydrogenase
MPLLCLVPQRIQYYSSRYIYLEKPGAASYDQMREMRDAADKVGCVVSLGYARNAHHYVKDSVMQFRDTITKGEGCIV